MHKYISRTISRVNAALQKGDIELAATLAQKITMSIKRQSVEVDSCHIEELWTTIKQSISRNEYLIFQMMHALSMQTLSNEFHRREKSIKNESMVQALRLQTLSEENEERTKLLLGRKEDEHRQLVDDLIAEQNCKLKRSVSFLLGLLQVN